MPKYTHENEKKFILRIRRALVINPDLTIKQLGKATSLDKEYISRLLRKIRGEENKRYDSATVNKFLAKFENILTESDKRLWATVNSTDDKVQARDKTQALKEIRANNAELFSKMADAGIFTRNLGSLKVETLTEQEEEELTRIAKNVFRYKEPNGNGEKGGEEKAEISS